MSEKLSAHLVLIPAAVCTVYFGKLKLAVEKVRKETSKREAQGMRLVSFLWH